MNNELKPCPFCGGMNLYYAEGMFYAVECADCGGKVVGAYRTEEEAVKAWNRRVQPTFTPDELDAIRRMFAERYPRAHKLPEIEQAIIDKCKKALEGGSNEKTES